MNFRIKIVQRKESLESCSERRFPGHIGSVDSHLNQKNWRLINPDAGPWPDLADTGGNSTGTLESKRKRKGTFHYALALSSNRPR